MEKDDKFLKDLTAFAVRYSLTRIKTETPHFKRDYELCGDGQFRLKNEKAVITALGKTSVIAIGEGEQYATYEDAEKATREHWSGYFKARRERRSDKEKLAEARRQKRYRERRKQATKKFKQQS